jgi:hypothetical protein
MNRSRTIVSALAVVMLLSAVATQASAQGFGCRNQDIGQSTGFGVSGSLYGLGYVPVPPYFALHPPVYYSYPVPRTYGYSPYAYPRTVMTPEYRAPQPLDVVNPYVKPTEEKEAATSASFQTASAPLMVINPFVDQSPATGTLANIRVR